MSSTDVMVVVVLPLLLALPVLYAVHVLGGPVDRARFERFVTRTGMPVTATNGEQVIRYLATTRRWRTAGLAAGSVAAVLWALPAREVTVNVLVLLAGWFVGALVAEARVAHLHPDGRRRAALLLRRRPTDYLPAMVWRALPLSLAAHTVVVAGGLATLSYEYGLWEPWHWLTEPGAALPWALAPVPLLVAVRLVQRQVLYRPQPAVAPDVTAADDAIRSRSLHVLSACGAAVIAYCSLVYLAEVRLYLSGGAATLVDWLVLIGFVAVPAVGWAVAIRRWPVPTRKPAAG
jgi:uncharacterized membrane protein